MSRISRSHLPRIPVIPQPNAQTLKRPPHRWPVWLIIAAVLSTYSNAIFSEFTTWDDNSLIYTNPLFNPPTMQSLRVWWTAPTEHLWNPTVSMLQGLLALLPTVSPDPTTGTRLNPYLFHAANILLHAASSVLIYRILRRLRFAVCPACAGALLFAVHPLQVEPVAWASALKDVLCGFFSLAAILAYLRGADSPTPINLAARSGQNQVFYVAATVLFLLAALSKVTACMLPLAVIALVPLQPDRLPLRRTLAHMGFWLLAAAPCAILALHWQPANAANATELWQRPLIAADTVFFYLCKLFWPVHLAIDYGRDPHRIFDRNWAYWTWIVPVAVAFTLWSARKHALAVGVGAAICAVLLFPALGVVPFDFQFYSTPADRYVYLPMFGVAIAFAWIVQRFDRAGHWMGVLLLVLLAIRSHLQNDYWHDSHALFTHTLDLNPDSIAALGNLSEELANGGHLEEAIELASRVKLLKPTYFVPRRDLAALYVRTGRIDDAISEYRALYPLDSPEVVNTVIEVTARYVRQHQPTEGLKMGTLAVELAPTVAAAHRNYGSVLADIGDSRNALRELTQAVKLDPNDATAQTNLGTLLVSDGRLQEGIMHYRRALRLHPDEPEAVDGMNKAMAQLHSGMQH